MGTETEMGLLVISHLVNRKDNIDMDNLLDRFSSRKFLAAAVATVIAVLADIGVIDPSTEATVIAHATPVVYILVEGVLDLITAKD